MANKAAVVIFLLVFAAGCTQESREPPGTDDMPEPEPYMQPEAQVKAEPTKPVTSEHDEQEIPLLVKEEVRKDVWLYGGVAVKGRYADADVVELPDSSYRMYYAVEPEVQGNRLEVFSAVSTDGLAWKQEPGVRKEFSTFPDVVRLRDGTYRMYYQNMGVIKSAVSDNGLQWRDESGVRIDISNSEGLVLENVAAPTVIELDGRYVMVYRGTVNERYPERVPNPNTQLLLWAESVDGLSFEKKGTAIDSRNAKFKGLIDGPELVKWDDEKTRLYFWSYRGVYHSVFSGRAFSEPELDYTTSTDPMMEFPQNPPGDPTLARIGGKWHMFYGQHTGGIHYAVLGSPPIESFGNS